MYKFHSKVFLTDLITNFLCKIFLLSRRRNITLVRALGWAFLGCFRCLWVMASSWRLRHWAIRFSVDVNLANGNLGLWANCVEFVNLYVSFWLCLCLLFDRVLRLFIVWFLFCLSSFLCKLCQACLFSFLFSLELSMFLKVFGDFLHANNHMSKDKHVWSTGLPSSCEYNSFNDVLTTHSIVVPSTHVLDDLLTLGLLAHGSVELGTHAEVVS